MTAPALRVPFRVLGFLTALAAAGCGATDPYIYKAKEFDRSAKDFNQPVTDRDGVTICYNGVGVTDAQIDRMAQAECARFGKVATRQEETFGDCPMLTPVQARFFCLAQAGVPPAETESSSGAPPAEPESSSGAPSAATESPRAPTATGAQSGVAAPPSEAPQRSGG